MAQNLQNVLEAELAADEKVLWSGQPLLRASVETFVCLTFAAIMGIIGFSYIFANNILAGSPTWTKADFWHRATLLIGLAGLLFMACFSFGLLYFTFKSVRNVIYAITTERILILTVGKPSHAVIFRIADISGVRRWERKDETGKLTFYYKGLWRKGFERIKNVRQLEELIRQTFGISGEDWKPDHSKHHYPQVW